MGVIWKPFVRTERSSLHRFYIDIHRHKSTRLQQGIERVTPALEKAMAGEELSLNDGMQLMTEENLFLLGQLQIIYAEKIAEIP